MFYESQWETRKLKWLLINQWNCTRVISVTNNSCSSGDCWNSRKNMITLLYKNAIILITSWLVPLKKRDVCLPMKYQTCVNLIQNAQRSFALLDTIKVLLMNQLMKKIMSIVTLKKTQRLNPVTFEVKHLMISMTLLIIMEQLDIT